MIRLGLNEVQKIKTVGDYIAAHGIKKAYVFYPEKFPFEGLDTVAREIWSVPVKAVEYKEIIMYRTFYPLLEEIDERSLLIFNECLRTRKRGDLTYNCAHHYCGQTPHKIVFERLPFIGESFYMGNEENGFNDFMILLDFVDKGRFRGRGFEWGMLREVDVKAVPVHLTYEAVPVSIDKKAQGAYEKKKEQLFNDLGNKEVDTIPRELHVFAGKYKKAFIDPALQYVARNARFNLPNVVPYKSAGKGEYIVVDFPHRRLDFNDFLKKSGMAHIRFLNSGLLVDLVYESNFKVWISKLEAFYAQTSLYQG